MNEVVLHIGLHKTATGTLQRQLFPNSPGLNLLTTQDAALKRFISLVTRKDELYFDPAAAREIIEPVLDPEKVNLISNESLSGPPYAGVMEGGLDHRSAIITNLQAVFPDAKVVLVLRRQDALARSLYRQYLKIGGTRRIRRFYGLNGDLRHEPLMSVDRFFFKRYVDRLMEAFPKGVFIFPFEAFVASQQDCLQRLSRFVGVPLPEISLARENATRLGPGGLEVTRLLNHVFRSYGNPGGIMPGIPVKNRAGEFELVSPVSLVHDHWPGKARTTRGEVFSVGEEILQRTKADNRALDSAYDLGLREYGYY